ncbi:MAG: terminase family protein [Victivallaceae bacterium]|nr:terminase family protein [Victivallaceae bacterium]
MPVTQYKTGDIINGRRLVLVPQPGPQSVFVSLANAPDIVFGGARGGGKTIAELLDWAIHAELYGPYARGIVVRTEYTQLDDIIDKCRSYFSQMGVTVGGVPATAKWPNGAILKFRHVRSMADAEKYQGHGYTRVYAEELTNWPDLRPVLSLKATLRSADAPVGFRATCNPGGPGHALVRERYRIPDYPLEPYEFYSPADEENLIFIPSRLEDNPALSVNDPKYTARVRVAAGSKEMAKAWIEGRWDITPNSFVSDVWEPQYQRVPYFEPPATWQIASGFDHGFSRPSALYFAAISDGTPVKIRGEDRYFPVNSVILFREVYTVEKNATGNPIPNEGLKLTNENLGALMERNWHPRSRINVADGQIFVGAGGPSIYDQMKRGGPGIYFTAADKDRISGAQLFLQYLEASSKQHPDRPGLYYTDNCTNFARTVESLQRSDKNPDDADTYGEDHAYDAVRYLLKAVAAPHGSKRMKIVGI